MWNLILALTFASFLIELHRLKRKPPAPGTKDWHAVVGRTIGDFLWISAIVWVITAIISLF